MMYKAIRTETCSHSSMETSSLKLNSAVAFMKEKLKLWCHNYRTRKALSQLDDRALSDIGLNRSDALEEARKAFWQK